MDEMNGRWLTGGSPGLPRYLGSTATFGRGNLIYTCVINGPFPLRVTPIDLLLTLYFILRRLVTLRDRTAPGTSIPRASSSPLTSPLAHRSFILRLRVAPVAPRSCRRPLGGSLRRSSFDTGVRGQRWGLVIGTLITDSCLGTWAASRLRAITFLMKSQWVNPIPPLLHYHRTRTISL